MTISIRFEPFNPCPAVEPVAVKPCEREADHDGDHWYTVWGWTKVYNDPFDGSYVSEYGPIEPVFWPTVEVDR